MSIFERIRPLLWVPLLVCSTLTACAQAPQIDLNEEKSEEKSEEYSEPVALRAEDFGEPIAVTAQIKSSPDDTVRTLSLGLAKDKEWNALEHKERMERAGLTDHATIYYSVASEDNLANPYAWPKVEYLDQGIPIILALVVGDPDKARLRHSASESVAAGDLEKCEPEPQGLALINRGDYDDELRVLAEAIADDGREVIIRPLYEGDGNWFSWGMYWCENTPAKYAEAFIRIADIFREAKAPVKFELNLNRRDANGNQVLGDLEEYFPAIDPYVDMYAISTYNRCGTNEETYQDWRSFSQEFGPAYERLAALTDKSLNVAEVSTTHFCGPRLAWLYQMLFDIERHHPQTQMVSFYFGTVPIGEASNDVPIPWGFDGEPDQRGRFRSFIEWYKKNFF